MAPRDASPRRETSPTGGPEWRSSTQAAIRTALRETVFRFELVMRVVVSTHELLKREALIDAVLAGQLAILASLGHAEGDLEPARRRRLGQCCDLLLSRAGELEAAQRSTRPSRPPRP